MDMQIIHYMVKQIETLLFVSCSMLKLPVCTHLPEVGRSYALVIYPSFTDRTITFTVQLPLSKGKSMHARVITEQVT